MYVYNTSNKVSLFSLAIEEIIWYRQSSWYKFHLGYAFIIFTWL